MKIKNEYKYLSCIYDVDEGVYKYFIFKHDVSWKVWNLILCLLK